jgi:precorrin-2 dehydrogenase/sirohydrochlorin ferrochelatase
MSAFYPIMLKMEGREAFVIGGGKVAERKIYGLLNAKAKVTIISPAVTIGLRELIKEGKCRWLQKEFEAIDIEKAFIVIAATNDREINLLVYHSLAPHQLINVVDRPDLSNFHVPSIIRRGKFYITISTSGASPILTKKIKRKLEKEFNPEYGNYVDFLFNSRQFILKHIHNEEDKQRLLEEITSDAFLCHADKERALSKLIESLKNDL